MKRQRAFYYIATTDEAVAILDDYFSKRQCYVIPGHRCAVPPKSITTITGRTLDEVSRRPGGTRLYLWPLDLGMPYLSWSQLDSGPAAGEFYFDPGCSSPLIECDLPFRSAGLREGYHELERGSLIVRANYLMPTKDAESRRPSDRELGRTTSGDFVLYETSDDVYTFYEELRSHFCERLVRKTIDRCNSWFGKDALQLIQRGEGRFVWRGKLWPRSAEGARPGSKP